MPSSPSSSSLLSPSSVLLFLVAFRLLNAFTLRTFFQPDEFFQSLEPAWQINFGPDSGAWITWEWKHHLRSSLHPLLFAGVYYLVDGAARILQLFPATRAELLIAAPKAMQAVIAAAGDYYTWKLARRVYGESNEARAALALTVLSPWQWFCSTRTLSNCLETTLTVAALYLWPWEWSVGSTTEDEPQTAHRARRGRKDNGNLTRLRQCLSLAALACILRPTNILIWMSLASVALRRVSWTNRIALIREVAICGSSVLALSALADCLFYGVWTFPPFRFLYFNLAQSLAVFYGKNDWHYYLSQGYPLLLTTALPFTLVGLYRALVSPTPGRLEARIQNQLALICIVMPFVLSLISHKEVRFIYPLLPALHILTAPVLVNYFFPAVSRSSRVYTPRRLILLFLLFANIVIALYTTVYHASGVLSVLSYLRQQQQAHSLNRSSAINAEGPGISAGFLMPCHSTPWRSHLVYPGIHAWALSCEPPVGLDEAQKAAYLDEADQFYANPAEFLRQNMEGGLRHTPGKPSYLSPRLSHHQDDLTHPWPDYLVFFVQLEPTLRSLLRASAYTECWRTFNTAWHDDWRRRGDIIVWCLDPAEQQSWRSANRKRSLDSRKKSFDNIIEKLKSDLSSSGRRKSPFQRWMANNDWRWPWEKRRRSSWMPELPEWVTSWRSGMPLFGGKRKSKTALERERDLWS